MKHRVKINCVVFKTYHKMPCKERKLSTSIVSVVTISQVRHFTMFLLFFVGNNKMQGCPLMT